jgi:lysophospholipase L1-like esterase
LLVVDTIEPSLPSLSSRRQVITAGLLAALGSVAAVQVLGAPTVGASKRESSSTQVSMIGDSLTTGSMPYQLEALSTVGWQRAAVDAYVSRSIRGKVKADRHTGLTSVDAIRATTGDSDVWVVALGTNDAGIYPKSKHAELINTMMDRIGGGHYVIWVNIYLPEKRMRQENWNAALDAAAFERPGEMFVLDWATLAAENREWIGVDGIHCSSKGYLHRATAIATATRSLVPAAPPVRSTRVWSQIPAG